MHSIPSFACTQSVCYLGMAHMQVSKLALRAANKSLILRSNEPHQPKVGVAFPNNRSGNQGWCCTLHGIISSVAGHFCTTTTAKMLCSATSVPGFQQILPTIFLLLAVSCLEFLQALIFPNPTSSRNPVIYTE